MDEKNVRLGLTFDDVLLEPRESRVLRSEVFLQTLATKKLRLKIPILSAAMDTVTEDSMASSLGKLGGMGVIHRNCTATEQVAMLKKAKKAKVPVAAAVGTQLVSAEVGKGDWDRVRALDKAGADAIVIDTAHAHVPAIVKAAKEIKKKIRAQLIIGNIATKEAALALVPFADAIKVGVGPGSICTTRVVAGVGVPQLTAIMDVVEVARKNKVPVIADGGMRYSGDIVKALAAGASAVMLGSMLAGTKEAPGKFIKIKGELYKSYRGMGSFSAMEKRLSADRYFQKTSKTLVPEGIEGVVKYKGPLVDVIEQIIGGLKSGMGYIGAGTIPDMWTRARFIRITNAGLKESHPHGVTIIKRAPNY